LFEWANCAVRDVGEDIILPKTIHYGYLYLIVTREDDILPYGGTVCFDYKSFRCFPQKCGIFQKGVDKTAEFIV